MCSNYLKHWDGNAVAQTQLMERYQHLLQASDDCYEKTSESSLAILDRFTYLAHYKLKNIVLTKELALELVQRSTSRLPVGGGLRWCMDAQYFAFGSKVLAIVCETEGLHDEAQRYYKNAIAVLELGDSECVIRARMLRDELAKFLARWSGVVMTSTDIHMLSS
jgi:hypothetical protein